MEGKRARARTRERARGSVQERARERESERVIQARAHQQDTLQNRINRKTPLPFPMAKVSFYFQNKIHRKTPLPFPRRARLLFAVPTHRDISPEKERKRTRDRENALSPHPLVLTDGAAAAVFALDSRTLVLAEAAAAAIFVCAPLTLVIAETAAATVFAVASLSLVFGTSPCGASTLLNIGFLEWRAGKIY